MIIKNVRLSFLQCFEPKPNLNGQLKYSACIMVDDNNKETLKEIDAAVKAAMLAGVEKGKFAKSKIKKAHTPIRNGSEEFKDGDRGPEFEGTMFFNAASNKQPGVVDKFRQEILDESHAYSGCYAHVDINFYPFAVDAKFGVAAGLNNIMVIEEGERLDGRQSAEQAFAELGEELSEEDMT